MVASLRGKITFESVALSARHILTEYPSAADGGVAEQWGSVISPL